MHRSTHRLGLVIRAAALALLCALAVPCRTFATGVTFSITGSGYGHGIGMSQYGAEGYAIQGWTYDRILSHYFQGTKLTVKPEVKVKVNLDPQKATHASWTLRAGCEGGRLTINGVTVPADRRYQFVGSGASIVVRDLDSTSTAPYATLTTGPVSVSSLATTGQAQLVQVCDASGPFGYTYATYRGTMLLDSVSSGVRLDDYLGMEGYVKGVVPRESPSSWNAEALKAQAVAARSYAYPGTSELYCTTQSQVYGGYAYGSDRSDPVKTLEQSSTDNAVDGTRDEYVTYGSTVVKTYFSSSAGGHTANVEDVWYSSTPNPYYVGVTSADAQGGSPDSPTWGAPKVYTASGMGAAVGSNASATSVAVQYAASGSGFVRWVTVSLSDGTTKKLSGTGFQSAFGLRSSKFSVTRSLPPAPPTPPVTPGATRYEESASGATTSGPWTTVKGSVLSGGTYVYTHTAGARMTVAFQGTGIVLVGPVYPHFGKAEVRLDGAVVATVDEYGPVAGFQQHLYQVTGLPSTVHTLTVTALGTKDSASTDTFVGVDAFDVFGTLAVPAPVESRVEQNAKAVVRKGTWYTASATVHSGGSYAYAKATGARMDLTFTGIGVKVVAPRYPNFGRMNIYIDGRYVATRSQYSAKALYRQVIYSSAALPSGSHVISVRWTGTRDAASRGTVVGVDAFGVLSAP
jgi:SpoIID/LytB domain protein